MGETEGDPKTVIKLSSPTPPRQMKKKKATRRTSSSSLVNEDDASPIRHILCVKNKVDVQHYEEIDDCFILDFDPLEPIQLSKLSVTDNGAGDSDDPPNSPDIAVVAEKGQVACRDYPHSRHLCLKFPFGTTPHESYCELCYCYVCDSAAPCGLWNLTHCHASENIGDWKSRRHLRKEAAVKK